MCSTATRTSIAHGGAADELLISARTSGKTGDADGISVFRVDPKASRRDDEGYRTIDGQHAADIELTKVKVPRAQSRRRRRQRIRRDRSSARSRR